MLFCPFSITWMPKAALARTMFFWAGRGTVFKHCIKDVLSLFLGCSASHLFRFGYLETEILRLEDLLIVVGGYLEVAGE